MKSLFLSKTFWVSVLSIAADVGGLLPPSEHVVSTLAVVHILLRYVTDQPVKVF
jgi:hypothetical protein